MRSSIVSGFTNLRLKYPGVDGLLFKGLSLSVRHGEKVLLLGPSGCGKSTMLQVLSGLVPSSIELPMKSDELIVPEHSGYVFQDPDAQFCMPYADEELAFAMENLCVPREDMPARIEQLLSIVGLQLENRHTLIETMSQGMKQRLALASVLALEPDVLFLDEPTALLDHEGTTQVWNVIKQNAANQTLIIVEHKIDEIMDWVDRIIVFTPEGSILAEGSPEYVFSVFKREFIDYGIWYPGVWKDYMESNSLHKSKTTSAAANVDTIPLLHMEAFSGFRGGMSQITVGQCEVAAGEWIAVIGQNGAGKSSLLLAIMRLNKTQGCCKFRALELKKVEQLAKFIALVFQNPEFQFVTNTVADEIAYSLKWEKISKGHRAQRIADITAQFELEPFLGRHPYQLSMGQKRRLSVAISIIQGQKLLLLDEPTFGLDARSTFAMLEQLEQLRAQGTTILMVTHDANIVNHFSSRVWLIHEGRLVKDSKEEVMTTCS